MGRNVSEAGHAKMANALRRLPVLYASSDSMSSWHQW